MNFSWKSAKMQTKKTMSSAKKEDLEKQTHRMNRAVEEEEEGKKCREIQSVE